VRPDDPVGASLLGDVVAFTALPAVWVGQPPGEIARTLAEALDRTLMPKAVAVLMRTERGLVEARAGDAGRLDADVAAWRASRPLRPFVLHAGIGPLGARGAILVDAEGVAPERLLLARLAANLADTATREIALQQEALAARERLLRLEKLSALGQLVSGVAHELRTPLTYANNNLFIVRSRLARSPGLTLKEREGFDALLADVLSGHERIERTVATLKHLSSPRAHARAPVVLSEVVGEATRLFALTNVGAVRVVRKLDARGIVEADPVEVHQIVLHLLQNAAEATRAGGEALVQTVDDADVVRLVVEDNGPGLAPEVRERIFEPFVTTKPAGTGLGLSIVRRIAEAHGATIEAGAGERGGARFSLTFPRRDTVVPIRTSPERAAPEPAA
jgi:signal transduction histidine kinase